MMDVLITQHAKWTARRVKRALFGQCLVNLSTNDWSRIPLDKDAHVSSEKRGINIRQKRIPRTAMQFSSFPVLSNTQASSSTEQDE